MINPQRVTIEKIVNGGYGLSHLPSGQVIMVRNVLPEECVIVTTQEAKKNYLFGKLVEIEQSHQSRVDPPCKYYNLCGGCDLQHATYEMQLQIKKDVLTELLARHHNKSLQNAVDCVEAPHPSVKQFQYRQRVRLHVSPDGKFGFHRLRTHDIVEIESCLLAMPQLNSTLEQLRNDEDANKLINLSREVELLYDPAGENVVCIFNFNRKVRPADVTAAKRLCEKIELLERVFISGEDFPIQGPFHSGETALGKSLFYSHELSQETIPSVKLGWEAGGFCQVNLQQNSRLIDLVLKLSQVQPNDSVLDLYCGMGNFSIPLAFLAKDVHGIEGQGSAIRSAKSNARIAGVTNTCFKKSPVEKECTTLLEQGKVFDCIVIDPPRQGAPELAPMLYAICQEHLVYISCDPATLCRDLAALTGFGFSISQIVPLDMFPQTHHVETVVLLKK